MADSTLLEDLYDLEAKWDYTREGPFKSFKLHAVVNQLGLPMRAVVTPGNHYDSPQPPRLLEDLEADYVLADAGYDSRRNCMVVRAMGAEPVIACNHRRGRRRKIKHAGLLKTKRYLVEQFNGHVKDNVLKHCWVRPEG
jgi:transposase